MRRGSACGAGGARAAPLPRRPACSWPRSLLWPASAAAAAQTPPTAQAPAVVPRRRQPVQPVRRPVLRLTRDEAVRMAVENNPDLTAAVSIRRSAGASRTRREAAYVPTLQTGVLRNSQRQPPTNLFSGTQGLETEFWSGERHHRPADAVGRWQLPGRVWTPSRTTTNSLITSLNPTLTARCSSGSRSRCCATSRSTPARAERGHRAAQQVDRGHGSARAR